MFSPLLFTLTINDIFEKLGKGNGGTLYADDAVMRKRGWNIPYIVTNIQKAIQALEQWGIDHMQDYVLVLDKPAQVFPVNCTVPKGERPLLGFST